jgi:cysteine-rich repeat protein
VKVFYNTVTANPELTETCGLDMALVMDISASIDNDEYAEMVDAMETFVTTLDGTPTHFSLVVFATDATVVHGFTEDGTAIIDEMTPRLGNGFTNWDDALRAARGLFPHRPNPDRIMFASDGNPNRRGGPSHPNPDTELGHNDTVQSANESEAMQWAIEEANAAKTSGIRIISVGIGNDLDTVNLAAVASADAVVTADFGTLAAALLEVAEALCGGTITVHKVIGDDGNTGTTGDQHDGQDWTFTCNALSPDSCIPLFDATDAEGLIGFEIDLGADTTATVNMVETEKTGYTFVSANCLDKGSTAIGTPGAGFVNGITVTPKNIISCTFYSTPLCGDGLIISPETCDDGNTNSEDGCSATCQVECVNPQTDCPAPSQCQIAVCDPTKGNGAICGTNNASDGATCNDTNACTQSDTCQAGSCTGSNPVICTAQDQCHDAGTCNLQIGVCSNPIRPDGTTCNDGNSQTTNDRCQTGNCEGDLPPASTCGNGIIEAGETCDDANLRNGDGCSSTCQDECVNPVVDCQFAD